MTPQELKTSILQLAIQGKLVEHFPKDTLIEEIKLKELLPETDIPFDIPETWCWCHLEDIATLYNGRAYKKPEMLADGKYPLLRVGNLFTSDTWYFSDLELEPEKYCDNGDLLYAWSASFGPHIWNGGKVIYHYHIWKVELHYPQMRDYLYWVLAAQTDSIKRRGHGSTMIHITKAGTEKMLIPVPPVAEQKRIVEKIEELLPLIDRYEQAWSRLEDFNKRFPVDMQQSILQIAIQGKLVPQLSEEGDVDTLLDQCRKDKEESIKAGKYKKEPFRGEICDEDIIPFAIPDSWAWMYISDMSLFQEGPGILAVDFRISGVPLIRIAGMQSSVVSLDGCNYLDEEMVKAKWNHFRLDEGDIVISTSASMDKIAEVDGATVGAIPYTGLIRFKMYGGISKEYFKWFIKSPFYAEQVNAQKAGGTIKHYGPSHLKKMLIPVPPLAEQKRIVAKLEELLPLCERLK